MAKESHEHSHRRAARRLFAAAVVIAAVGSCADPQRAVTPPSNAAAAKATESFKWPDAAPPLTGDAAPPLAAPSSDARTLVHPTAEASVLTVEYVNLATGAAVFEVDAEGHGSLRKESAPGFQFDGARDRVVQGSVSMKSLEKLRETLVRTRFCATRAPDAEPMTFTRIHLALPAMKCQVKMAPDAFKTRAAAAMRVIHELEEEVCAGPCPGGWVF